ncbi:hypothetical protein BDF21DRAFT_404402 [Thamnidium elegans]|nr:hypothetical protein BDF21DRAFT_404402 [Thamnidium elegans]
MKKKIVLLDILETVARNVIVDARTAAKSNESEMTSYRKVAMVLDLMLNNLSIDLIDYDFSLFDESNIAVKQLAKQIPSHSTAVLGASLIFCYHPKTLSCPQMNGNAKKNTLEQLIAQQTKNIRMNNAILSKLHELPLLERDAKHLCTMSIYWAGPKGYAFAVKKIAVPLNARIFVSVARFSRNT